jgi:3-methyladenine DNA glycosylase AlkC
MNIVQYMFYYVVAILRWSHDTNYEISVLHVSSVSSMLPQSQVVRSLSQNIEIPMVATKLKFLLRSILQWQKSSGIWISDK